MTRTPPSANPTEPAATGCSSTKNEPGTQLILNEFPNRQGAEAFAADPSLPEAMARAGISGPPRIEFYEIAEHVDY